MKRYIAKTNVSVNIVLATGANRHIAFSSLTGGGSVFYTDDPEIEKALESHYKYGTLFNLDDRYTPKKTHIKPTKKTPTPISMPEGAQTDGGDNDAPTDTDATEGTAPEEETSEGDGEAEDAGANYKTVVVTDPDAAKAYLAEHFGISRTKLKKVETIKKVAAENSIVFEGI